MCGIAGLISRRTPVSDVTHGAILRAALADVVHRGPDHHATFFGERVWLGHSRLAIIDLSEEANQPFVSHCGRYVCVFNGAIYNFRLIRDQLQRDGYSFRTKSDTEVLLASLERNGVSCLENLVGMFAFAVWDNFERTLVVGRDRFGEKPLFFFHSAETFAFASEPQSLLTLLGSVPRSIDERAVDGFLRFGFIPESLSLFKGIQKVMPGTALTLKDGDWTLAESTYWSITRDSPARDGDVNSRITLHSRDDVILASLRKAVANTLESDVPIAIGLSGGIDSAAIAALARQVAPDTEFAAICVGYPGRPKYDERSAAAMLAKTLRIPLHEVEIPVDAFVDALPALIRDLGEPVSDIAAFAHAAVPRAAHELGFKVLLTGLGGDEIFWGYPWVQRAAQQPGPSRKSWKSRVANTLGFRRDLATFRSMSGKAPGLHSLGAGRRPSVANAYFELNGETAPLWYLQPEFRAAAEFRRSVYGPKMQNMLELSNLGLREFSARSASSKESEIIAVLVDTWLVANSLAISDRVSMAVGVESRAPFLDVELVETVMQLRKRESDVGLLPKAWLRSALKEVLPAEVLARPKRGFQPPVSEWMRGALDTHRAFVLEGHLISDGFLDPRGVEGMLRRAEFDEKSLEFSYRLLMLGMGIHFLTN